MLKQVTKIHANSHMRHLNYFHSLTVQGPLFPSFKFKTCVEGVHRAQSASVLVGAHFLKSSDIGLSPI